jgi:ABC-type uncharacterized transport system ATPase subunit
MTPPFPFRPSHCQGQDTMTDGQIVNSGLTKRYGALTAVDDLSFPVQPGRVTGFLGPNGPARSASWGPASADRGPRM